MLKTCRQTEFVKKKLFLKKFFLLILIHLIFDDTKQEVTEFIIVSHSIFFTESFDQVSSNLRPAAVLPKLFSSPQRAGATHAIQDRDTFLKSHRFSYTMY